MVWDRNCWSTTSRYCATIRHTMLSLVQDNEDYHLVQLCAHHLSTVKLCPLTLAQNQTNNNRRRGCFQETWTSTTISC